MSIRRGVLRIGAIMAAAIAGLAGTIAPAQASDPFATPLTNTSGNLCAILKSSESGTQLWQSTCNPTDSSELWSLTPVGLLPGNPVAYTVYNDGRGLCLDGYDVQTRGISAFATTCSSATTQEWTLVGTNPHLSIRNVASGACLVANTQAGSLVYLGFCPAQTSQGQWNVVTSLPPTLAAAPDRG